MTEEEYYAQLDDTSRIAFDKYKQDIILPATMTLGCIIISPFGPLIELQNGSTILRLLIRTSAHAKYLANGLLEMDSHRSITLPPLSCEQLALEKTLRLDHRYD